MAYYCMQCWNEIDEAVTVCPSCGADQKALTEEPFVQKLLRALRHPEPETPIRAAYVLGKLRAREGVLELIRLMHESPDPYIAAACAEALGEIGGTTAFDSLRSVLTRDCPLPVWRAAEKALQRFAAACTNHD